ncbi:WXG100 family type VII secretion target [Nocardia mexicana]|uniref:ESAT-6-like protein n=1 Tax=Nocardia mexicana TaxID=279262 RepID=A0A370H8U3_9NOCA|nr:WXG100 family type VII secretion target [Nocardia mexicana]RDI52660.1 WXG100 family type VII secretion target [Nocardia mexicana]
MGSQFSVDLEQLDQVVARLNGLAGFVRDHLDGLDDKVAGLSGFWESVAAQAYTEAHREWSTGAREFADGVAEMSDAARKAHERYTRAVDLNLRMWRGE